MYCSGTITFAKFLPNSHLETPQTPKTSLVPSIPPSLEGRSGSQLNLLAARYSVTG